MRAFIGCALVLCGAKLAAQTPPHEADARAAEIQGRPKNYEQALQSWGQGDLVQAEQQLLQVIQTNPDWAGAWLDLALLALQQKRYAQAEELVFIVEEKFKPLPEGIQQALVAMRKQLAQHLQQPEEPSKTERTASSYTLAWAVGYDSNANAGLRQNNVTLTLPTGDATLQVDKSSQAQGARYTRAAWVHQSNQELWGAGLKWQWQLQARQNQGMKAYDSIELAPQATLVQRTLPGDISLAWQNVWLDGKQVYKTPVLRWQHQEKWRSCELQNALQTEFRQYTQMDHLNSQWAAYKLGLQCQKKQTTQKVNIEIAHENAATLARPGGDTRHLGWGYQQEWRNIGQYDQHNLLLRIDWLRSTDTNSYSSFLDKGRPRNIQRVDWQLNWSAPVTNNQQWRGSIGVMQKNQKSNISIFNQKNKVFEMSIWKSW